MKVKNWYRFENRVEDPTVAEIYIIDWIGDWVDDAINRLWGEQIGITARAFVDQLAQLPEGVLTLNVHINSPGGDVAGGVNIANALRQWGAKSGRTVTTYIDGWAASIASVIAMAGTRVVMSDNALMFLHDPWSVVLGNARDFRKAADDLDAMRDGQIVSTYKWHATIEPDAIVAMMAAETWLNADEAIAAGFATEKAEGLKAAASINPRAAANLKIPEQYRDRVNAWLAPKETPVPAPVAASVADVLRVCREGECLDLAEGFIAAHATLEHVQATVTETKTVKATAAARATAITALCARTKQPDLAEGYIAGAMSPEDVGRHLTIITAKIDKAEIDAGLNPDAPRHTIVEGWKNAFSRVQGRLGPTPRH